MTIRFLCPRCGTRLSAANDRAGQTQACRACGAPVMVPNPLPPAFPRSVPPTSRAIRPLGGPSLGLPPPKLAGQEDLVDMTAMVDIVFFLLIFFMVTVMQDVMLSLETPPPDPQKLAAVGRQAADTEIDADAFVVRIESDDTVWLENEQVIGEHELRRRLQAERRHGTAKMVVSGHADAHHKTLVMVLDAGNNAGFEDMKLMVVEQDS